MKRGHELMADHAKELAKQKLRELAETVQTDAAAPGDGKVKHVDAGEKIGGARKDYARRSLTIEDLDSMNDMERKTYVLKKNVWASLNYQQMREDGVTPQAAIAIKYLKDAINVEPDRRHSMIADDPRASTSALSARCVTRWLRSRHWMTSRTLAFGSSRPGAATATTSMVGRPFRWRLAVMQATSCTTPSVPTAGAKT
ncbi:hypothetical protein [Aeromonas veronii]|uniref:hypothetical protein n=1 Tax=Aeromonas veronii TaxID=654 RepID=UPI000EAD6FC6|nr:hypothetical protein [Aeromonas veronii]AYK20404.1 hypothetical protein C0073_021695 [Aeromonas veronii]